MATPSNMPAYAQGNAAAAAAAKAEAARLAAVKKATPAPTPKLQETPAPAPVPKATTTPTVSQNVTVPPKSNAQPAPTPKPTPSLVAPAIEKPAGMPVYAVSNDAAAKYSLANTYDTVAADAKAKNDALAKSFKDVVAPQTDSILRSVASNSIETDEQKRARLLKDGSVAIRARSMTPEQQKATWGIVIDFNGGPQIAPEAPQQAKPDTSFLTPTFQPQLTQPTVAPTPQMPVYATGNVDKIQDYTTSNVAPMTDADKQKAFIDAVNARANVLGSLEGSRIIPSSSTSLTNQAIQDVTNNLGIAQGRTSVSPSTEQPAGALLGAQTQPTVAPTVVDYTKAATPSTIIPSGAALGEAGKSQAETAKAFIDKLSNETYGTPQKDVFATSEVEKPVVQNQVDTAKKEVIAPPQESQKQTQTEYTYGQESVDKQRWVPNLGWVSPEVFNQIELNNKGVEETLAAYKRAAETPTTGYTPQTGPFTPAFETPVNKIAADREAEQKRLADEQAKKKAEEEAKAAALKELMARPVESVNPDGTTRTPETGRTYGDVEGKPNSNLQYGLGPITDAAAQEIQDAREPIGGVTRPETVLPPVPFSQDLGTPQEQPATEDAFRLLAQKQIDEQMKQKNADLDLQIKQATENRDFSAAQQLQAYKNAIRDVQNQAFLSGQGITQGMANRGLLNSGMYSDALLRSGMGSQQQIRQLAEKQQSNLDKATLGYNQTLEKINKAKADLASGSVKDVQSLTKQLIADQQSADKYKADVLKAQATKNSEDTKQIFDYVQLLAKENNYDISGLLPYAISGDVEGMTNWMQKTGNLKLSQAGREIQANIDAKKASIGVSQSQKAENLAQASKGWSDIFGIATDASGRPVKDKNGNVIPTQSAREASAKLLQQAQNSKQSATMSSQANALGWAKLQETINYHQAQIDKADKQVKKALDMDKEASTRDYFKLMLDDSTKHVNSTKNALYYDPKNETLLTQYNDAVLAHKSALNNVEKYYTSSNKPQVVQLFPTIPAIDFTNGSYLKAVDWKKDSSMGTPKSGK